MMGMIIPMLHEFEYECAQTRKLLERVPEDRWDWTPHLKSMSLQRLAGHLAEIPKWVESTLKLDVLTMDPGSYVPFLPTSTQEILDTFDAEVARARELMAGESDEHLMQMWSLKSGDHVVVSMPRIAVLRSFIISHSIHHRAQLTVYLRMNDVPLPSIYGPSADDSGM
jgi:uncharacterized damage-inducible protein DinB